MGCCWGVFGVLGDFGPPVSFVGVVLGHFELISGEESDRCSATDFQRRQSRAVKTCSGGESERSMRKGMVLGILKIMFICFRPPGVGSYRPLEVGLCI
jgi:hypothetical protein